MLTDLCELVKSVETIMSRYTFKFYTDEYSLDRVINLQESLIRAYLKEYAPDVDVESIKVVYNDSLVSTSGSIHQTIGYVTFKHDSRLFSMILDDWRIELD